MKGPKIVITLTEEDGKQTTFNADYLIGSMHAEGDPMWKMDSFALGRASLRQMAAAKCHIDDLFHRIAAQHPELIDEYLSIDPKNTTSVVERFEMGRAPKEGLT